MASKVPNLSNPETWSPETQLVHGGVLRSQFAETSEALFLTQGYVYKSAEQAEARFKGESPGYQYTRFGNPTVSMFEERMSLLEGAEDARATATGMAAVTAALLCYLEGRRPHRRRARHVRLVPLHHRDAVPALRHRDDAGRRPRHRRLEGRDAPNTKMFFFETPANPTLELVDIAAVSEIAHAKRHARRGRQRVRDAAAAEAAAARRRHRHLLGHQAHRRPGPLPRRRRAVLDKFLTDHLQDFLRQTGPSLSPFNAWVLLKGLETLPVRVERNAQTAAGIAEHLARQAGRQTVIYLRPRRHPAGRARQEADDGRRPDRDVRDRGRQAPRRSASRTRLRLIKISNNLGDAKSLITHPTTTTHYRLKPEQRAELGISDGMLRLSVGLEAAVDLAADLDAALAAARAALTQPSGHGHAPREYANASRLEPGIPAVDDDTPYEAVTRGIRIRVHAAVRGGAVDARRGLLFLDLHGRDRQRGRGDRAAALAPLADHRRQRPHGGGARPGVVGQTPVIRPGHRSATRRAARCRRRRASWSAATRWRARTASCSTWRSRPSRSTARSR